MKKSHELMKKAGDWHESVEANCGLEPMGGMTNRSDNIGVTEFVLFMRHLRNVMMTEELVK